MPSLPLETYAAIDAGSNAVRLLLAGVFPEDPAAGPRQISWIRLPIRLGADTFAYGKISRERTRRFEKVMEGFSHLIEAYQPVDLMACATAAIRNAENGEELCEKVRQKTGISIEIIDGAREAAIQFYTQRDLFAGAAFLCVDVGGGSTEVTVFLDGQMVNSRSFDLGAIRLLQPTPETEQVWKDMEIWIRQATSGFQKISAIGTGGNINAAFQLAGGVSGKPVSHGQIQRIYELLKPLDVTERCARYGLKPDRADVLTLGLDIYMKVMKWANCREIHVPMVGLCHGIISMLYEKHHPASRMEKS